LAKRALWVLATAAFLLAGLARAAGVGGRSAWPWLTPGPHDSSMRIIHDGLIACPIHGDGYSCAAHSPASRYIVHEDDGALTRLMLDFGHEPDAFDVNYDLDDASLSLPEGERAVDLLLISHFHEVFVTDSHDVRSGGLHRLVTENPDMRIYMPDPGALTELELVDAFTRHALLDRAVVLQPGLHQLSSRIWVWTHTFQESNPVIVWRLNGVDRWSENVLIVRTDRGYHVHAVCAHRPVDLIDDRRVHAVEAVQAQIGRGLPDGVIHTLVTGGCDFGMIGQDNGHTDDSQAVASVLRGLHERIPGLEDVILAHCALGQRAAIASCKQTFGLDRCTLAFPGYTRALE